MSDPIEYIAPRRIAADSEVHDITAPMPQAASAEGLVALLAPAIDRGASDIHLVPGYPPMARMQGKLEGLGDASLRPEEVQSYARAIVPADPAKADVLANRQDIDCSYSLTHGGNRVRFRANLYKAQEQWCVCLRHVSGRVPTLEGLGFPEAIAGTLMSYHNGLVIFTGTTGAGKSSSLAALIQVMADRTRRHVLTIEEPIEFQYSARRGSLFTQREVGRDVGSFADGLKFGLRQDPDIILVGETRDRDTAQMVLSAAETGHLVFTTLHTRDAKGALTRLIDLFPIEQQEDVRKQLALSLRSVVSQQLLPSPHAKAGRVLALEVLHINQQAETTIRTGRIETLDNVIVTGRKEGMCTFDDDMQRLVKAGLLPPDVARRYSRRAEGASRML